MKKYQLLATLSEFFNFLVDYSEDMYGFDTGFLMNETDVHFIGGENVPLTTLIDEYFEAKESGWGNDSE